MGLAAASNRTRSPRAKGRQGGFTLLEVLVAIVLLGFSYAGILSALSQSIRLARASADQENAALLARSLIEENRALPKSEILGSDKREVFGGTRFGYKVEVRGVPLFDDIPADKIKPTFELKRITADVYWGEREPKRHYRLSTLETVQIKSESANPAATPTPQAPTAAAKPDEKKP